MQVGPQQAATWKRRQAWAFSASIGSLLLMIAATIEREFAWSILWSFAAVGFWMLTRRWNRISPIPFPYALRWLLHLRPLNHSPRRLAQILQPRRGERLLEIGPGIGTHALAIASALAPNGVLDVVDVQQSMLDAVSRRAQSARITNIATHHGDAARLPFDDGVFDGAYLIGVLGEIPDGDGALRELSRVVKPGGRLVVGELLVDPDFVPISQLRARAKNVGFVLARNVGSVFASLARFERDAGVDPPRSATTDRCANR